MNLETYKSDILLNFPKIMGEMELKPFREVMDDYNGLIDKVSDDFEIFNQSEIVRYEFFTRKNLQSSLISLMDRHFYFKTYNNYHHLHQKPRTAEKQFKKFSHKDKRMRNKTASNFMKPKRKKDNLFRTFNEEENKAFV